MVLSNRLNGTAATPVAAIGLAECYTVGIQASQILPNLFVGSYPAVPRTSTGSGRTSASRQC